MPCDSSYLKPNGREQELQRAAQLYVYVLKCLRRPVPDWAQHEADNQYATDERSVTELCAVLSALAPHEREVLVYDAHNATARALADWWEEHQEADAARKRKEAATLKQKQLRESALAKLTPEERAAVFGVTP